jgi:hypothetical protein
VSTGRSGTGAVVGLRRHRRGDRPGLAAATFAVTSLAADGARRAPRGRSRRCSARSATRTPSGCSTSCSPAERAVYQPFIEDLVGELQRLDVLDASLDLGVVDGVDFQVDGPPARVGPPRDGVSVVRVVGGVLTSSLDPAGVPIGSWVREQLEEDEADLEPVSDTTRLGEDGPLEIVVIDDGGWHVSLHHSIAELARNEADLPAPDLAQAIVPDGADSPEAAVEELVRAAIDLDVRRVIALTPPGEMSALHQYAPLFLPDLDEAIAELRAESSYEVSLDRSTWPPERDGDEAVVTVAGFAASGVIDDEPFELSYDGSCPHPRLRRGRGAGGLRRRPRRGVGRWPAVRPDARAAPAGRRAGRGLVREPIGSMLQSSLDSVRAVQPGDLDDPSMLFLTAYGFGMSPLLYGLSSSSMEESSSGSAAQAYPEEGVEAGPSATIVDDRCTGVFDELPADADEEQWADAERAFDECLAG